MGRRTISGDVGPDGATVGHALPRRGLGRRWRARVALLVRRVRAALATALAPPAEHGTEADGPPADWMDRVRRGAPHLLEPGPAEQARPASPKPVPHPADPALGSAPGVPGTGGLGPGDSTRPGPLLSFESPRPDRDTRRAPTRRSEVVRRRRRAQTGVTTAPIRPPTAPAGCVDPWTGNAGRPTLPGVSDSSAAEPVAPPASSWHDRAVLRWPWRTEAMATAAPPQPPAEQFQGARHLLVWPAATMPPHTFSRFATPPGGGPPPPPTFVAPIAAPGLRPPRPVPTEPAAVPDGPRTARPLPTRPRPAQNPLTPPAVEWSGPEPSGPTWSVLPATGSGPGEATSHPTDPWPALPTTAGAWPSVAALAQAVADGARQARLSREQEEGV